MAIKMLQRIVGKHHVVTMLPDFKEGQTVIVARIDSRTAIVSMEPPEKIQEMVQNLPQQETSPWEALMTRVAGRPNSGTGERVQRHSTSVETEDAVSDEEAMTFATITRPRRKVRHNAVV